MTKKPNWWPKLRRVAKANDLRLEEAVSVVTILHDDGCARLEGVGVCDCDPDVRLVSRRTAVADDPEEKPNWLPKLRRAAKANGLRLEKAVSVATIIHDDGCARLVGTGICDCDPDVRLVSRRTAADDAPEEEP